MANSYGSSLISRLRRAGPWLLLGLCLYWFLPAWYWHFRRTMDPYAFNDDARILIWPFFRQADPALFPDDPFVTYYLAGLPEGFLLLYRGVGRLGLAIPTSELLQYLSVGSSVLFLAATAKRLGGTGAGYLAAMLTLGSESFFERAGGGLPRAFAFPLISAGLYAMVTARPLLLAVLTILGAAFYPVVAAILGLSLGIYLLLPEKLRQVSVEHRAQPRRLAAPTISSCRSRLLLLAITGLCVVALTIPMTLRLRAYGSAINESMLPAFPEAAEGGRLSREHRPPYEDIATLFMRHSRAALLGTGKPIAGQLAVALRGDEKRTGTLATAIAVVGLLSAIHQSRKRSDFLRVLVLPLAAIIGHALACRFAPRLFLPERYGQYAVPPFIILAVATCLSSFKTVDAAGQRGKAWARAALATVLVVLLGGRGTSYLGVEVSVPPEERPLYAALTKLPRDAVVAGWPAGPAENIPYLSFRRVLSNFQLEMPFHDRFTLDSRARLEAFFTAYFATTALPIARLCSQFHVTHLLIDPMHFKSGPPDYYEPHRARVAALHSAAGGDSIVVRDFLSHPSTQHFARGLGLVELARIPALAPACSAEHRP